MREGDCYHTSISQSICSSANGFIRLPKLAHLYGGRTNSGCVCLLITAGRCSVYTALPLSQYSVNVFSVLCSVFLLSPSTIWPKWPPGEQICEGFIISITFVLVSQSSADARDGKGALKCKISPLSWLALSRRYFTADVAFQGFTVHSKHFLR